MTALEEIKKALEGVTHAPGKWESEGTAVYCDDATGQRVCNTKGEYLFWSEDQKRNAAVYIAATNPVAISELLSTLESVQRENAILQERTADYPTISARLHDREKARDAEQKACREAIARAEAAEAKVKQLTESRDGYVKQRDQLQKLYDDERASCIREAKLATDMAADCNDAQARAETAESCLTQLRKAVGGLLDQAEHVCLGAHTPADIKEDARNLATPIKNVHTALASTGGEHNAE